MAGLPKEIISNLYAGPGCIDLEKFNINADLIITLDPSCVVRGNNNRIVLPIEDFDVEPIINIGKAVEIIENNLKKGKKIYVHCHAGCGRTGTVIVSYLILYKDMQLNYALDLFYSKRGCGPDSMPQELFLESLYKLKRKVGSNNLVVKALLKSETLDDFLSNLR
ncbi:putative protein-tyrosine phosphatase [Caldisphaera lagunensis DSM 15908]|uniref:Tyrosine specific protein phosphatases domain-containing protein n=1 Tax=Caldisphaera lagunensis (strain DSM 15908 / JCM 11604 / ANMR 0165 / IC-154) TaxID=1056495 RepID=L0AA46_CALLD|nr:dual specificity protein phosphatase family protein [Caldisphaera lagunensis]AFZ70731.1 putative protein-tyrosine phosphatase [Caldisphaera lagunensis DSM 15908]